MTNFSCAALSTLTYLDRAPLPCPSSPARASSSPSLALFRSTPHPKTMPSPSSVGTLTTFAVVMRMVGSLILFKCAGTPHASGFGGGGTRFTLGFRLGFRLSFGLGFGLGFDFGFGFGFDFRFRFEVLGVGVPSASAVVVSGGCGGDADGFDVGSRFAGFTVHNGFDFGLGGGSSNAGSMRGRLLGADAVTSRVSPALIPRALRDLCDLFNVCHRFFTVFCERPAMSLEIFAHFGPIVAWMSMSLWSSASSNGPWLRRGSRWFK